MDEVCLMQEKKSGIIKTRNRSFDLGVIANKVRSHVLHLCCSRNLDQTYELEIFSKINVAAKL